MKSSLYKSLVLGAVLLVALFTVVLLVGFKVPLTMFKSQVEQAAGNLIHRQVKIDGGLYLTLSLQPAIEIQDFKIANPAGWPENMPMFSAHSGTGQLDALSLISGNIRIMYFRMSEVDLNLVTRADHTANYRFGMTDQSEPVAISDQETSSLRLASVDEVYLDDINIVYHDMLSGNSYAFSIGEVYGTAREAEALELSLKGQFAGQPLSLDISGDELAKLVQLEDYWSLNTGVLTLADTSVSLTGNVTKEPGAMSGHMDLSLAGSGLTELGRSFGISLPDPGEFTLDARMSVSPASLQATSMILKSRPLEARADLLLSLHGERPTLMGTVWVDHFALDLIDVPQDNSGPEKTEETTPQLSNMLEQKIPLDFLRLIDTDVRLRGSAFHLGKVALDEMNTVVSLVDGDLVVPLHADVMGVVLDTQLEIQADSAVPRIEVTGEIRDADLTSLTAAMTSSDAIATRIGRFDYAVASSGKTLKTFIKNIQADIQVNDAISSSADGRTIFATDAFSITRSEDLPWKISGDGQLMDRPFSTKALVGKLHDGQDGTTKGIQLNLEACDTELEFGLLATDKGQPVALSIAARGHNFCNVLKPAEQFLGDTSNFTVTGHGELGEKQWKINLDTLGLNTFSGSAVVSIHSTETGVPFMTVDIHSPNLNIDDLLSDHEPGDSSAGEPTDDGKAALPQADNAPEGDTETTRKILTILKTEFPTLKLLEVADMDLVLQLDQLIFHGGTITDVHLDTHLRDGKIINSPFSANMGGTEVSGSVELDLKADEPVFTWNFSSSHAELSHIFSSFGLPQSPDIKADSIAVSIVFKGNSLLEMMQTNSQEIRIENGLWKVGTHVFNEPILVKIDNGTYASKAKEPTVISITGSLNDEPLELDINEDGLLARGTDRPVELSIKASVGDLNLRFEGRVERNPGGKPKIHLDTLVSGSRLDKLNRLLKYDLPPIGPYRLHGALHTAKNTLSLDELQADVGSSSLTGEVTLTIKRDEQGKLINPSLLKVNFKAPSLQLDDFHIREWTSVTAQTAPKMDTESMKKASTPETGSKENGYADLLSSEFSDLIEAHLEVSVEEVLSGTDRLGSGYLSANNRDGRNSIESMRIEVPGGFIEMNGYFQEKEDVSEADFHLNMDQFDYGILVRRAVPESDIKGLMNVRIDLSASADDTLSLREHANGKLRVAVVPEQMEAGIVDLWAVNILAAALPKVMKGSESEINCIAADFTFDDGMITPEVFLLDTSKMRVQGEGFVNLKDEAIDFHMKPTPKSPQFFSLATPVDITGTIRDFHIGVSAGSVIGTVFRVISGVITVPLQKIFTEDMAADGVEACSAAMAWVVE